MSKILDRLRKLPHVQFIDDERWAGNPIMIVLAEDYDFADDPGCGSKGVDTIDEAKDVVRPRNIRKVR
jgi:hypothetical protein